jgi:hypothetical protein
MRLALTLVFLGVLALAAAPNRASAADISALLVTASKTAGASDARLKPYEATLRRILRFESFRLVGEGSTRISAPGIGQIGLGGGHQLHLEIAGDNASRVEASWHQGKKVLMKTGLSLRAGVPAVLGGPGTGKEGEVYAIIVIAQ